MSNTQNTLAALRRPKTLVRAARIGASAYKRERDLAYAVRRKGRENMVATLIEVEERLESNRKLGESTYSAQRHISILSALIAESQLAGGAQAA